MTATEKLYFGFILLAAIIAAMFLVRLSILSVWRNGEKIAPTRRGFYSGEGGLEEVELLGSETSSAFILIRKANGEEVVAIKDRVVVR